MRFASPRASCAGRAVGALDRKLLRGLWHVRGQALAIAVVIASGVAVLVMSLSTLEALRDTTALYYERYRFADVFASAVRAPEQVARRIAELQRVEAVEPRIARYASLDIEGFAEPVIGRLTSIPEQREPTLNRLVLRTGRWVEPQRHDEVLLSEPFAEAHALVAGDRLGAIVNGRRRELTVVGTALSPEFIYALAPGALLPDDRRFGVLWMGREALEAAYDLDGAFNDLAVAVRRGAAVEPVIRAVDTLLAPYGGSNALPRAEQQSNWFVMNEIDQLQTMARILPAIFLAVAAFLTYMVLVRLIDVERSEIGLLKAFGYTNLEIAWHYLEFAAVIAVAGIVLGAALGAWFGFSNTEQYAAFFRFPLLVYRPSPVAFAIAAAVSLAVTTAGALAAVRKAVRLPPAEAMRPPAPANYRHGAFADARSLAWLDQPTRIALRQVGRFPLRSALTSAGIALSVGLLVLGLQWSDSIDRIAQLFFYDGQRQNVTVGLGEPLAADAVHAARHWPGVLAAEPARIVGAEFTVGTRRHRGAISGVPRDARLRPIHDDATGADIPVPPAGLMLGAALAAKLGVEPEDRVYVEILEGRRPSGWLDVVGVSETAIGLPAYMELGALNRLLEVRPSIQYVDLLVDSQALPALFAELKRQPKVTAVMSKQAAIDAFYATLAEHLLIYIGVFSAFAVALGFGVAYNSARVALSERGRELATLRVLGFTRGEVAYVLFAELALLVTVALPVGCLIGRGLTSLMAHLLDTELFRLPLVIEPATYGFAVVLPGLTGVLSAAVVRRRIDRLDLIGVLKTRE
jgi:putative ABC transport system permease protein